IPYQKVEINIDESLEAEPEDEEEGSETGNGMAATGTGEVPPPAPLPQAAAQDGAALRRELAGLIGRIGQVAGDDAARKATLVTLATQGNDSIKANSLEAAAQFIAQLRDALTTTGASGTAGSAAKIWTDAKDVVDQQLGALYAVLKRTGLPVLNDV